MIYLGQRLMMIYIFFFARSAIVLGDMAAVVITVSGDFGC